MIIKSGEVTFHKDQHPTMLGSGVRNYSDFIRFDRHFRDVPKVVLSVRNFDILNSANARVSLSAADESHDGFELTLHTWADTRIWALTVSWIAYAAR